MDYICEDYIPCYTYTHSETQKSAVYDKEYKEPFIGSSDIKKEKEGMQYYF